MHETSVSAQPQEGLLRPQSWRGPWGQLSSSTGRLGAAGGVLGPAQAELSLEKQSQAGCWGLRLATRSTMETTVLKPGS